MCDIQNLIFFCLNKHVFIANHWICALRLNPVFQFILTEHLSQLWILSDHILLAKEFKFWFDLQHFHGNFVDFGFDRVGISLVNLTLFIHVLNKFVLVLDKVILCSPVLDSLTDFREYVFNLSQLVHFSFSDILPRLIDDLFDKEFVLNCVFDQS